MYYSSRTTSLRWRYFGRYYRWQKSIFYAHVWNQKGPYVYLIIYRNAVKNDCCISPFSKCHSNKLVIGPNKTRELSLTIYAKHTHIVHTHRHPHRHTHNLLSLRKQFNVSVKFYNFFFILIQVIISCINIWIIRNFLN